MIDWKKYVDHIYIVNYTLTNKHYLDHFYKELNRVNINRYDIDFVTDFMNIQTPLYELIYNMLVTYGHTFDYAFSCSMGHYYCMKHAQNNNYNRILILENDAVFFKNISVIINLLDNVKKLFDSNKCDLFLGGSGCEGINDINVNYNNIALYNANNKYVAGTTFNIYNETSYNQYINLIENGTYYIIDTYSKIYDLNKVWVSNPIICVQKEWDLIMDNLYEYYNMPSLTDESINRANKDRYYMIWEDNRNLHKLLAKALEHNNLIDKYKDIYEDCKKNF